MLLKDKVTFAISVLAFTISVITTVRSELAAQAERDRTIRTQLSDTLSRITKLGMDNEKARREYGRTDPEYFQTISGMLNTENTLLLRQAMRLSEEIPGLVSSVELNAIAYSNANAGDLANAEIYYKRSIETAENDQYKALALRSYAAFLFPQRRFEEGRDVFKQAVSVLKGGDNLVRSTNGFTYQMWAVNEAFNGTIRARVDELFEAAHREFAGIDNEFMKVAALHGLMRVRENPGPAALSANASPPP